MLHPLTLSSVPPTHLLPCLWDCFSDLVSRRASLQKLLSDLQSANQQKLKEREQELKDMKKMMEQMKVGQR